jgi:hypothetical protein
MWKIRSREYKMMLDHGVFADRKTAVESFWEELQDLANSLGVDADGQFDSPEKRTIVFLDTPDFTLRRNGVIFRRREGQDGSKVEYTLKCRSEDRYVANGIDLREAEGLKGDYKFEEDIAAPFASRFSHSNTVKFAADDDPGAPEELDHAAKLFPLLSKVRRDGEKCPGSTRLRSVNNVQAFERVYKGPRLQLDKEKATVALILWSNGSKGRPLMAEFSFRYGDDDEDYKASMATSAKQFFEAVQRLDWCRPDGMTKTQYVYRGTG